MLNWKKTPLLFNFLSFKIIGDIIVVDTFGTKANNLKRKGPRIFCVLMIYCVLNNNTFKLFLIEHILAWNEIDYFFC